MCGWKSVKIREMLFKNLKLLFGNTHQTSLYCYSYISMHGFDDITHSILILKLEAKSFFVF